MKNIKLFTCLLLLLGISNVHSQQTNFEITSPNGELKVSVNLSDKIYYSITAGNEVLTSKSHLALILKDETLGTNPKLSGNKTGKIKEEIKPVVPLKFSSVSNNYNYLLLNFKGNYSVEFRAFDEGIAYRFITAKKGEIEVVNEDFTVNFPDDYLLHLQQTGNFKTSYEEAYSQTTVKDWKPSDKMSTLPILVDSKKQYKILISESDLSDYAGMFLKGTGTGVVSTFPKTPLEFGPDGDRSLKILKEANYIAKTSGTRNFPWRYFVITKNDKQLIENTMTLKLAPKSELKDASWIKPGQASWEWWNGATPYGPDVNFVSGYNLDTYKYYIDFASKFGIKYIIMDEGWANSTEDPYSPNPNVNVQELIRYGKEKKVGIVLWLTWLTVDKNMELFKTFKEWGIAGVKIDFMDRSDQVMVNYYEKVVKEAAKHQIFVDFHGAFKPSGLEYKYPNLISYEGVRGMEQMDGCKPDNSLYFPFMRNAVGPMDYTPGAMISMQPEVYRSERPNSASIGTRAYQLALFVVFESGLQMLADNPTLYYREKECTDFITSVPTTWDETKALEANAGKYAIVAKRKGTKWFIGGITNSAEKERSFEIKLDFLTSKKYKITSFEDGINAGYQAMDYRKKSTEVSKNDILKIKMVRNGGWAAVLEEI
ncbi:alpha-glucosidase [Flavobacterium sp. WLB]|uniref:glycoside hydrolase family 97 protein n=1 Tax=unclassified Flavobacterium TaxID=196869 RepID=UPI0006ABA863|nr:MULTISPECIES: glycoside hydrolase family 97 protein [unclassified Flavobacterium]KOP39861.1 alpha-glucosidase [Flavobacterium sp. VMW]OWU92651.1 alpha-glucosidase [Flavobacterium sp. NLM]PUU71166.1 alpha-glucosidase [Flavobacterium sp. WLB]